MNFDLREKSIEVREFARKEALQLLAKNIPFQKVCDRIGCSRATLYNWKRAGKSKAKKIGRPKGSGKVKKYIMSLHFRIPLSVRGKKKILEDLKQFSRPTQIKIKALLKDYL